MDGRAGEIQQMCGDMSTCRSLADYIDEISYGQMQIECHFPQLEDVGTEMSVKTKYLTSLT